MEFAGRSATLLGPRQDLCAKSESLSKKLTSTDHSRPFRHGRSGEASQPVGPPALAIIKSGQTHWSFWLGFNLFVLVMRVWTLRRSSIGKVHTNSKFQGSSGWSAFLDRCSAFAFAVLIAQFWQGRQTGARIRNRFMWVRRVAERWLTSSSLIVSPSYFQVEPEIPAKVLFWGIIGAAWFNARPFFNPSPEVAQLIQRFHWIHLMALGVFLIFNGHH